MRKSDNDALKIWSVKSINHYWSAHDHCACCWFWRKSFQLHGFVEFLYSWREQDFNFRSQTNRNRHNWNIWQNTWPTFFTRITSVFSYLC